MAELLPLRQGLTANVPTSLPVARRGDMLLTRADLLARAGAWAATLQRRPEHSCAVYVRDGFEFISVLFGAWQAGKAVWLPGNAQPGTCAKLRNPESPFPLSLFIGEFVEEGVLTAPDDDAATFAFSELAPELLALIVFTSGSTGTPAAIPKTLWQLDTEVAAMQAQWGALVGQAQVTASVPHQHFYGLLFKVLWPLCRGAVFESLSLDYPEQVCASLACADTVWIAGPSLLQRLPADLNWRAQHLRALFCAGGPLPLASAQQCAQLFGQWPREAYGSSETGVLAERTQENSPAYWQPLPDVNVRREPETGQLEVRGPWLQGLPDDTFWLMADRGEVHADGSFSLLPRADRIVKVAEKRISLDALEHVLSALAEVQEARLFQFPGGRLGAVAILSPEGMQRLHTQSRATLIESMRGCLTNEVERVALPRRWRFVAEFPRNALGKITHEALQSLFVESDGRPRLPQIQVETRPTDHPEQVELDLFIQPDLIYFDGHFPGAPILPGVVQLDWAIAFARRYFGLTGPFQSMAQIKFQQVIQPAMRVRLSLIHLPAKSAMEFLFSSAGGAHSSGRILFGA